MSQTADALLASLNQQDVARRLQEYQALLANDSLGILVVCDGEIMQCNPCAARLFGWDQGDLLGRPAATLFESEAEFQSFASRIGDALAADGSPAVEWRTMRRNGARFWARLLVKNITPGGLAGETVWMVEDITERKATEAELARAREELEQRVRAAHDELAWTSERLAAERHERTEVEQRARRMALYDQWTGLPNRRLLESRLDEAVRNHQLGGDRLAVLVADIDDFARLNDALGRRVGDALLKQVAERMVDIVRTSDLVARSGADEFAVVLGRLRHTDDAERVASTLSELLAEPFTIDGEEIVVTASIGIARYPSDGVGAEMLLRNADAALAYAKGRGAGRVQVFEPRMNEELLRRLKIEAGLRRALDNGDFEVHFQPRIGVASGRLAGAEALVRWRHPELGVQEPASFMGVAEDTGLICPIGEFVLRAACDAAAQWSAAGLGDLGVGVNLSTREFRGRSLLPLVGQALADSGLAPHRLQVEITEASLLRDRDETEQAMRGLRAMGVKIALDHFGTGYSSLSSLHRYPVDILMIDGRFIRSAPREPADARIVAALAHLAHDLGLTVVAEGIETPEQLDFVKRIGCDEAQGFLLGRPASGREFVQRARA